MPTSSPATPRQHADAAADALRRHVERVPAVAVIAESGLSALVSELEGATRHPLGNTPSGAEGEAVHVGALAPQGHDPQGPPGVRPVALTQARCLAGGFSAQEAAFPVRVLATLGVQAFVLLGEAVALAPRLRLGRALLVADHLNLQGANPLVGPNEDDWGPRFPDMSAPYDAVWRAAVREEASRPPEEGIYAAVADAPTPAEQTMLRRLGADAVGAGLVPEVLAARHMGRRALAAVRLTAPGAPGEEPPLADLMRVAVRQAPVEAPDADAESAEA